MNFKNILLTVFVSVVTSGVTIYFINNNKIDDNILTIDESTPVSYINDSHYNISPSDFTKAAETTVNAVVHVTNIMETTQQRRRNYNRDFYWGGNQQRSKPMIGSGSGVIITKDGYIVTNNHVIDKSEKLQVTLNNQKSYTAKIIGVDTKTDIALLKIEADNLPYITLSNSDNVRLGEWVLAVGNPFNLTSTVTAGIISAIGRDISLLGDSGIESFLQTDAVVNPGNSGGALVNTNGDLIGINTAISTHTGSFEGYSFAVPTNIVKKVVEDLLEFGKVQRAYLGINILELNANTARQLNIEETEGIYVSGFSEKGFALKNGLKTGDIINKIDNKKIRTFADLRGYLASKRPGDMVDVQVIRHNANKVYIVELTNSEGTTELNKFEEENIIEKLNADLTPLTRKHKMRLGIRAGVLVDNIGNGLLKQAGIRNGYIILRVQNKWVSTKEDIETIITNSDKAVLMEVANQKGYVDYYAVKL